MEVNLMVLKFILLWGVIVFLISFIPVMSWCENRGFDKEADKREKRREEEAKDRSDCFILNEAKKIIDNIRV